MPFIQNPVVAEAMLLSAIVLGVCVIIYQVVDILHLTKIIDKSKF